MKTRKCVVLVLVGLLYIQGVNLRIVEGTPKKVSLDNDLAIEWAGLEKEMDLFSNTNYEFATALEYDNEDVEYEFDRNSDKDGSSELDDDIDEDDETAFEINLSSITNEGSGRNDGNEEDEDVDPCVSQPHLPECNEDVLSILYNPS